MRPSLRICFAVLLLLSTFKALPLENSVLFWTDPGGFGGDFFQATFPNTNQPFTLEFWSDAQDPSNGGAGDQNYVRIRSDSGGAIYLKQSSIVIESSAGTEVLQTFPTIQDGLAVVHYTFAFRDSSEGPSYVLAYRVATNTTFYREYSLTLSDWSTAMFTLGEEPAITAAIDELRMWNYFRTTEEVAKSRNTIFGDPVTDYPQLLAYYQFEVLLDLGRDSSISAATNAIVGSSQGPNEINQPRFFPLNRLEKRLTYNQATFPMKFVARLTPASVPFPCPLDFVDATTLLPISNTGSFSTIAKSGRYACGLGKVDVFFPKLNLTLALEFNDFSPSANGFAPNSFNTIGGTANITGVLGVDGPFAPTESVTITFPDNSTTPCANATVAGGVVRCRVPEGVGSNYSLSAVVCKQNVTIPGTYKYRGPVVTKIIPVSRKQFKVSGINFGPVGYTGVFVSVNNVSWIVSGHNHTEILVTAPPNPPINKRQTSITVEDGIVYSVSVTVDGNTTESSHNYTLCANSCQNGGVCETVNFCECPMNFGGKSCEIPVVCAFECQNGAPCRGRTEGNTTVGYCDCGSAQNVNPDCSAIKNNDKSSNTGAIVGAVVASVGAALIIAAIVLIVVKRKYANRRGGKNFIPVEKRDFTTIIYGQQINENPAKSAGKLKALEELLVQDDLSVVTEICAATQITEADQVTKALVIIFQNNNKVMPLLKSFIGDEINSAESAGTLFRSNSVVSKMFKFYSKLIGMPYLYTTVGPEISELIEDNVGCEIDPEKMSEGTDLDEMRWTLMAQSQKILKSIFHSTDVCPSEFKEIFNHIRFCVNERFPEKVYTTIGGFLFLRFFCPAISAPEGFGILDDPPSEEARRMLILITKVLQSLSNDVEFGSKEPYMIKLNDFIHSNREKLQDFYSKLLRDEPNNATPCEIPKNMHAISLCVLEAHIRDLLPNIENAAIKEKLEAVLE